MALLHLYLPGERKICFRPLNYISSYLCGGLFTLVCWQLPAHPSQVPSPNSKPCMFLLSYNTSAYCGQESHLCLVKCLVQSKAPVNEWKNKYMNESMDTLISHHDIAENRTALKLVQVRPFQPRPGWAQTTPLNSIHGAPRSLRNDGQHWTLRDKKHTKEQADRLNFNYTSPFS